MYIRRRPPPPAENVLYAPESSIDALLDRFMGRLAETITVHNHSLPPPPLPVSPKPQSVMWDMPGIMVGNDRLPFHDPPPPPQIKCGCCLGTYNKYNMYEQPSISCTWYYVAGCPLTMPWMNNSGLSGSCLRPCLAKCPACETKHLGDRDNRTRAVRRDANVKLESPTCNSCLTRISVKVQELVDDAWDLTRASLQQRVFSDKSPTPPLSHALFHINPLMDLITEYANPMARSPHHDATIANVLPKPPQIAAVFSVLEKGKAAVAMEPQEDFESLFE